MSISVKKMLWLAAALLALAIAFVLPTGPIKRLVGSFDSHQSAAEHTARYKIPDAGRSPATGAGEENSGPTPSMDGVTRTYFKPSHSAPAEAVRLEISAVEQNDELLIVGKLFDGSTCSRLQIDLELKVDDGRKVFHSLILGQSDQSGERPIRSKRRLVPSTTESPTPWRVHVAALQCLDP